MTQTLLADFSQNHLLATRQENPRWYQRAWAWVAVVLLHVFLFMVLVITAGTQPPRRSYIPQEAMMLLRSDGDRTAGRRDLIDSSDLRTPPEVRPAPITLPPPPEIDIPQVSDRDLMQAIGRELACGAGQYEYMPGTSRRTCRIIPWGIPRDRRFVELPSRPPPNPTITITGAMHDRSPEALFSPCPAVVMGPCASRVIRGQ